MQGLVQKSIMTPEDCLGVDLVDYLLDLGFDCEIVDQYMGGEDIDLDILGDDGHPEYNETFDKWWDGLTTCVEMYNGEQKISFNWSTAEIVHHSNLPDKVLKDVQDFIDNYGEVRFVPVPEDSDFEALNPENEKEVPSLETVRLDQEEVRGIIQKNFSENLVNIDDLLKKINEEYRGSTEEE